ncbi:hypothetical protein MMC26_006538 [Xylographa opegraphella]|nr:hypothetical protein [Xylographa opegraphella]
MSVMDNLTDATAEPDVLHMAPAEEDNINNHLTAAIERLIKARAKLESIPFTPAQRLNVRTHIDTARIKVTEACIKLDLQKTSAIEAIIIARESVSKANAEIEYLKKGAQTNLSVGLDCGEPSIVSAKPSEERISINFMDMPREVRDKIYQNIFGVYHIHVKILNGRTNSFHMESMNGLLVESLRFHLQAAELGLVSERANFHHGYWPVDDLHHRICQRANNKYPTYECGGKCHDLARNKSTLSLASLRTCRMVYEDARLMPYRLNNFEFTESDLLDFLRTRSPDQISAIRSVKVVASVDRCRLNERLTQWVSGILQRSCLFKNLTSIMFSAKYVAVNEGQLWTDGYLMTTPQGLCCQVMLGQDKPGVEKFWWTTLYFGGEFGIMWTAPDTVQNPPAFVNLLPSAPISLLL